jgi:hypothetical protein
MSRVQEPAAPTIAEKTCLQNRYEFVANGRDGVKAGSGARAARLYSCAARQPGNDADCFGLHHLSVFCLQLSSNQIANRQASFSTLKLVTTSSASGGIAFAH